MAEYDIKSKLTALSKFTNSTKIVVGVADHHI